MKNLLSKPKKVLDPVCGMTIDTESAAAMTTFSGNHYYFCNEGCKHAFEKDPCNYLKNHSPKRKGWWGRYLDRLNKATEGKSMQCH